MTRPSPAGTAPGAGPTPVNRSLTHEIVGVVRRPRSTFQDVVSQPRWGLLLLLTTLAGAAAGAGLMATAVGRQALVDQWERTATAFGQPVDDSAYAQLQSLSDTRAVEYAFVSALLSGPVLTLVVGALLAVALRGRATFRQVLAVATYAGVILAVRQVIAAPVSYVRETTANPTALSLWFPTLDEASPVARFLGALDLFVIWWAIVLAIGVSVLSGRRARTVGLAFVGVYAALALLLALAMAAAGSST